VYSIMLSSLPMKTRWTTSNKAVFNIGYHLIWCPKYRRKVLTDDIAIRLKVLLLAKAENLGVTIETMEVMEDHVHLFVKTSPVNSPHYIVQQFKGYTSRLLRQNQ
jgi:putative transposase